MSESKVRYLCEGFFPIEAQNVMHAALLFALQIARRRHGPKARCSKLDLHSELRPDGATFEAFIGIRQGDAIAGESHRFSVLIDHRGD
jgi:hypothetical protein